MSYDIYAFAAPADGDVEAAMERMWERLEADDPGPVDPEKERRKRALANALVAADPTLEEGEHDWEAIAADEGISDEDARRRNRSIELYGPELQISLDDDHAAFNFPYWDSLDRQALVSRLRTALTVMRDDAGYVAYDPQLERTLDPSNVEDVVGAFDHGVGRLKEIVAEHEARESRPWWRRVLRR